MVEYTGNAEAQEHRLSVLMADSGKLWLVPMIEEPDDHELSNSPREVVSVAKDAGVGSLEALISRIERESVIAAVTFSPADRAGSVGTAALDDMNSAEPARMHEIEIARHAVALASSVAKANATERPIPMGKGPDHDSGDLGAVQGAARFSRGHREGGR